MLHVPHNHKWQLPYKWTNERTSVYTNQSETGIILLCGECNPKRQRTKTEAFRFGVSIRATKIFTNFNFPASVSLHPSAHSLYSRFVSICVCVFIVVNFNWISRPKFHHLHIPKCFAIVRIDLSSVRHTAYAIQCVRMCVWVWRRRHFRNLYAGDDMLPLAMSIDSLQNYPFAIRQWQTSFLHSSSVLLPPSALIALMIMLFKFTSVHRHHTNQIDGRKVLFWNELNTH